MSARFLSLVELARARALERPDALAYALLDDEGEVSATLTAASLDRRARAIARALSERSAPGVRALLLFLPGLEFITAFFGCLYAGVVAVPVSPPSPRQLFSGLERLRRACGARVALAGARERALLPPEVLEVVESDGGELLDVSEVDDASAEHWRAPRLGPDDLAFLQYTSGSTSAPRGVKVSHGNILHNLSVICEGHGLGPDNVSVSWLPVFHDMGLIGGVLGPLFGGFRSYLMAPETFLRRPERWLQAISRYRGTYSGGPTFAYELCVQRITPAHCEGLDLSRWRAAYCSAEPVRASAVAAFQHRFAPWGLTPTAVQPSYGLAEATLKVTTKREDQLTRELSVDGRALERDRVAVAPQASSGALRQVSCGRPVRDTEVVIVDPSTLARRAEREVGEIWVRGPSVASGYWNDEASTAATFGAQLDTGESGFLRTGDLGFLDDGELFVTGRLKDLVILRGRKLYPGDIEQTVEGAHPHIRRGRCVAFSISDEAGLAAERLVVVAEAGRRGEPAPDAAAREAIFGDLVEAVADRHEARATAVALLAPGHLPLTSSGKLQRSLCRQAYLRGELPLLGHWGTPPAKAKTA